MLKRCISILLCFALCIGTLVFVIPVSTSAASTNWAWPTSITSLRSDWPTYSGGGYHGGTDFPVSSNSPVYSTCDGEVVAVTSLTTSYGKHIKIRATVNGETVYMRYCHLNGFNVSVGDRVYAGQQIGISGSTGNSTGPHLHYEVRNANDYYGSASSPNLNPRNYLPGSGYAFETWEPNNFPGAEDTSWNVPVWKTANYKANTYDSYGTQESNRWIDSGDNCYIEKVYQNGFAWVKYPSSASSDGYRWAFTKADVFSLEKKGNGFPGEEDTSWNVPVWKSANSALNTYDEYGNQESNRWIDQGDSCYIEHVYKNGYAWVKYPSSASDDGWRWAYTTASGFSLEKKNWYSGQSPVNVGTDFYAYIINTAPWKHLTNDNNNVSIRTETGEANQVWKFDRLSDGSYQIINAADGKALDDDNFGTSDGSNVQVWNKNDSNAQKWFIYGESGAYYLRAACGDLVLDVNGGASSDGTNVQMWTKNESAAQKFQIWKLNKAGQTHVYCHEGTSTSSTVISWDATVDTTEYDVKIWKGALWEGDAYKIIWGEKGTSVSVDLPEGDYEAYVDSRNKYSITMSENTIKFSVKKGYITGDINNDNSINMKDIVLLQQYLNHWDVTINADAADVNKDDNINMKDIVLLQQYMNGWDVSLG